MRVLRMHGEDHTIRPMLPGEAAALQGLMARASEPDASGGRPPPALCGAPPGDMARWLEARDVFVAASPTGEPLGFAAGADATELYWISGLYVPPGRTGAGLGGALLRAVTARAGWFFHRAVALSTYRSGRSEGFLQRRGFVMVPRKDCPPILEDRLLAEMPAGAREEDRVVMVRWL